MKRAIRFWHHICLATLLLFTVVMSGCTAAEEERQVLRWGLIPADDAAEMLRQYQVVVDYLEDELDIEIEIQVTNDYTAAIEAMRNKHIDMAWFGPFSYVLAVEQAGAEAIVNGYRRDTKKATYKSIIITRAGSGIKTLDDLKNRSFAFVDPASTSGYLIPSKIAMLCAALIHNEAQRQHLLLRSCKAQNPCFSLKLHNANNSSDPPIQRRAFPRLLRVFWPQQRVSIKINNAQGRFDWNYRAYDYIQR